MLFILGLGEEHTYFIIILGRKKKKKKEDRKRVKILLKYIYIY